MNDTYTSYREVPIYRVHKGRELRGKHIWECKLYNLPFRCEERARRLFHNEEEI